MILNSETVKYFSLQGLWEIRKILLKGFKFQMETNWDGEDLEFEYCCKGWSNALENAVTAKDFGRIFDDMNNQAGDIYGTEGWEKGLGLPA